MKRTLSLFSVAALALAIASSALIGDAAASAQRAKAGNAFGLRRLVSDQAGVAANVDPNLINAWGLAAGPTTPWWVNAADSDVATIYNGKGEIQPLVVDVAGGPTGMVFNDGLDFMVSDGMNPAWPSVFLFDTEAGTIRGWNPQVPPPAPSTQTFVVADRSGEDANYKGLAIASTADGDVLYAADFHNARVDMFDGDFNLISDGTTFVDPDLPAGYGPFGIQELNGDIFVTYAKQDADAEDEVTGAHRGFVDRFDTSGAFLGRVASRHSLNAPWGLAMAPAGFGRFGGDLLVGNFGDGLIHVYEASAGGTYTHVGKLRKRNGDAIAIDGLWALAFGNDDAAGSSQTLFFTAGPDDEAHGLFGKIRSIG
jgi:uncharacterized protein (TIGR03118 family)